jgi:hypothetical protein
MPRPLECTSGASRSRRQGLLVPWIGLALLCVFGLGGGLARAAVPLGLPADGSSVSAAHQAAQSGCPAAVAARSEDRGDRFTPAIADEGALGLVADTEPTEETGETPAATGVGWADPRYDARPRHRPDPMRQRRRVRIGPTRAPPVIARTVG